jgi:capsular polysaccharide biosynthesis protein
MSTWQFFKKVYYSASPSICTDLEKWVTEKQVPMFSIFPSVCPEVEPYIHADIHLEKGYAYHYHDISRQSILAVIEKAVIRDSLGLVELPDGQVCLQGNWYLPYLKDEPAYKRIFPKQKRIIKGNVYSLLGLWSQEFYHWFHDILPRLEFALPYLPSDTKFLIHENPKVYQLESLKAYGINSNSLEEQPVGTDTKVEKLWFATPIGQSYMSSAVALNKVSNRLKKFFALDKVSGETQNIYISRKNASSRRILNELALENLLLDFGIKSYLCEQMSLSEQINLFSNAKLILAPHGAGLVNMIYAPNGTLVTEITRAEGKTVPCYILMANQLGHKFSRFLVDSVDSQSNMTLNLKELEKFLISNLKN